MIENTNNNQEFLAIAISSGEMQAREMLENGTPEQKLIARRYLDCLENIKLTYNKPIKSIDK